MVLGQVLKMTVIGGALGLAASLALGRVVQSLLFQMQGDDPMVLLVAGVTATTGRRERSSIGVWPRRAIG